MNDLELLREFEPVISFTEGEMFFPSEVEAYVRRCSLRERDNDGAMVEIVPRGELSLSTLDSYPEIPSGHTLYLRFVDQPLRALDYQRWLRHPDRPSFQASGRLSRVGLPSRLLDSLFNLSLLVRGTVPGGTTAAAEIEYRAMFEESSKDIYYGRVRREGGYIVLQYLFFYPINNWRSSFYGVNDHEADWEQVFIYLSDEPEGRPRPLWVAYAAHDFSGDDLRRRWDDPDLQKFDGNHPIIYAGAGSHASYFLPGEYLMGFEPAFLAPIRNAVSAIQQFWSERLGQGEGELGKRVGALLNVPFVDYARGDGVLIGPGQQRSWRPILLEESMGWVERYRGLWGLDTRDFIGGERAPAGPKFNRNGTVRQSWYDPLGWAGLDKVPPPHVIIPQLQAKIEALTTQRAELQRTLDRRREELRSLALEVEALQNSEYLETLYKEQNKNLDTAKRELHDDYKELAKLDETHKATERYLVKVRDGQDGDPQAHIRHKHDPEPRTQKQRLFSEIWAALSGGLLLLVLALLLLVDPDRWILWLLIVGVTFAAIEAIVRGHLARLLLNLTLVLAAITTLILIRDFFWWLFLAALFGLVLLTLAASLRELRQS